MKITSAMLHNYNSKYYNCYVSHFHSDASLGDIRRKLETIAHIGMMLDTQEEFTAEDFNFSGNLLSVLSAEMSTAEFLKGIPVVGTMPFTQVRQEEVEIHVDVFCDEGKTTTTMTVPRWVYRLEWTPEEVAQFVQAVYEDLGIVRR